MLGVVETFRNKYDLKQLVISADAGMMSNQNIKELCEREYKFIIGGRIKNESEAMKSQILSLRLNDGQSAIIEKQDGQKMIVSYSIQRAKKDEHNRKRGLNKLEKLLSTGKLAKKHINNKGYNKYLKLDGKITVVIDYINPNCSLGIFSNDGH